MKVQDLFEAELWYSPSQMTTLKRSIKEKISDDNSTFTDVVDLFKQISEESSIIFPSPADRQAWAQVEELIKYAVNLLSKYRGSDADWRLTPKVIRRLKDVK